MEHTASSSETTKNNYNFIIHEHVSLCTSDSIQRTSLVLIPQLAACNYRPNDMMWTQYNKNKAIEHPTRTHCKILFLKLKQECLSEKQTLQSTRRASILNG